MFTINFFQNLGIDKTHAEDYSLLFSQHHIREDVAASLTNDLLREIGVRSVGDRLRILKSCSSATATTSSTALSLSSKLRESCDAVRRSVGAAASRAKVAIVLGSGLGVLARELSDAREIAFGDIPHFPLATAPTHSGKLMFGRLRGVDVVLLQGRVHLYEGYSAAVVAYPVQLMRALGAATLLLTNACGGINRRFAAGDVVLLTNHLNLTFQSPLVGPNDDAVGVRWPHLKVSRLM
jgi:hypothetical protein